MVYLLCTVYTVIKTWEEGAIVGWKRNDRVHPDWRRVKYCYQKMENDVAEVIIIYFPIHLPLKFHV